MKRYNHKYIFYFYPKADQKGIFIFYGRVSDGKETAKYLQREYDYKKIY